ncbi:hypothetical protein ACF09J_34740 [Streptomyces sp. NPDC014889]|uniref:hypothetical protein n=1 Tax=Streptomyces sp. NPDC014889 TaxID=3364928 RepID=UPI003702C1D4
MEILEAYVMTMSTLTSWSVWNRIANHLERVHCGDDERVPPDEAGLHQQCELQIRVAGPLADSSTAASTTSACGVAQCHWAWCADGQVRV